MTNHCHLTDEQIKDIALAVCKNYYGVDTVGYHNSDFKLDEFMGTYNHLFAHTKNALIKAIQANAEAAPRLTDEEILEKAGDVGAWMPTNPLSYDPIMVMDKKGIIKLIRAIEARIHGGQA
jgi:hypothetical protein